MTGLPERTATRSSPKVRTNRSAWLKQRAQERESWRAKNPRIGQLTVLNEERAGKQGYTFRCRCDCGAELWVRWADLRTQTSCKLCAASRNSSAFAASPAGLASLRERAVAGGRAAAAVNTKWTAAERRVARILAAAYQRCTNPSNARFADYGARGIKFLFDSREAATRWVVDNLGLPAPGLTLDRIDNARHYEPGNLRWATRLEQARNRRGYKNAVPLLKQARALRPDLSDTQLRVLLKRGLSLNDIKQWVKYASSRV